MTLTLTAIALITSIVGSICGIGGGVIIKPLLDAMNIMSVSAISFLSGCTVLAMSLISVGKSVHGKTAKINKKTTPALGVGAVVGGLAGRIIFDLIKEGAGNEALVGLVQAVLLGLATIGTFIYMYLNRKGKIRTRRVENLVISGLIGLALGVLSSFLGIGGGPINLAVLSYFFSMDAKESATNSLCIILLSQLASLTQTLVTASVPNVEPIFLVGMVLGGALGGFIGQTVHGKMKNRQVEKLFDILLIIVTGICVYNICRFASVL